CTYDKEGDDSCAGRKLQRAG
ncbi:hypothetical protein A2U01_0112558, partial [Trifolium medium]|nr:hypothetical protein [Trifolium medium]